MVKIRVGVLRGGPSREYEVSLNTGKTVLEQLPGDRYEPKEIFIDKAGRWHVRGMPVEPARALSNVDVVFNALHGEYGEDGQVQKLLETHNVRYTGSDALASAVCMNKALAKGRLQESGVRLAHHRVLRQEDVNERTAFELFRSFPMPAVLKPVSAGSSVGVVLVRTYHDLFDALEQAFSDSDTVLIEQYILGKEATVGVIDGYRGVTHYALPPIEIVPTKNDFFDYAEKYDGLAQEVCPARFGAETNKILEKLALEVHKLLNLKHYSRSDFIVTPHGVYFLEVNTLPGLTEACLVPKALTAVGSSLPEFLDHVVQRALA
jgi:D-alanine-D-alanine ligase